MRANEFENEVEVDISALRAALAETAAAITRLKQQLRRTWTRPMAAEQRELLSLKEKATLLCILRAFVRGRRHLQAPMRRGASPGTRWDPEAYHRQAAEHAARRFGLVSPVAGAEAVQ
jgi:hypothetical protein